MKYFIIIPALSVIFTVVIFTVAALVLYIRRRRYILDGDGMINPKSWDSFTVSRTDSYAQHNFNIRIDAKNGGLAVSGDLRGNDGTEYEENEGILISKKQAEAIYALCPEGLPDVTKNDNSDNSFFDGVEVLDAPTVKIEVFCTDGRILEKADVDGFSISVYQIVVGSFKKKHGR